MRPRFSLLGAGVIAAVGLFMGGTNERDPDAIRNGVTNVIDPTAQIADGAGDLLKVGISEIGEAGAVAGNAAAGAGNGAATAGQPDTGTIRVVPGAG